MFRMITAVKRQKSNPKTQYFEKFLFGQIQVFPSISGVQLHHLEIYSVLSNRVTALTRSIFTLVPIIQKTQNRNKACHLHYSKIQGLFSQ